MVLDSSGKGVMVGNKKQELAGLPPAHLTYSRQAILVCKLLNKGFPNNFQLVKAGYLSVPNKLTVVHL